MGEIKKALFNKVRYVNDQGKKSKAYNDIEETFNIYEGEGDYLCVNNSTGAINKDCKEIVKPNENNELMLFNDFIIVKDTSKLGKSNSVKVVNLNGNVIKTFDNISEVENFYSVVKDGKFGLLDGNAKQIFECVHNEEIKPLENDLFVVDGKKRFSPEFKFNKFNYISDSKYIIVEKDGKYALLNTDLSVILDAKYDSISIVNDKIQAKLDGKLGIYNLDGEMLVDHKLETGSEQIIFSEGLGPALLDTRFDGPKFRVVDENLNVVSSDYPGYDEVGEFKSYNGSQPYALVRDKGNLPKYYWKFPGNDLGLRNKDNTRTIPCEFAAIEVIAENLAMPMFKMTGGEEVWCLYDIKNHKRLGAIENFNAYDQSKFKIEFEDGYYKIYRRTKAKDENNQIFDYAVFDSEGTCVIDFIALDKIKTKSEITEQNAKRTKQLEELRAEYRKEHNIDGRID